MPMPNDMRIVDTFLDLPYECQYTGLVDEVCWFFPDLKFVFRHGCDPWDDLAVKLLLK